MSRPEFSAHGGLDPGHGPHRETVTVVALEGPVLQGEVSEWVRGILTAGDLAALRGLPDNQLRALALAAVDEAARRACDEEGP